MCQYSLQFSYQRKSCLLQIHKVLLTLLIVSWQADSFSHLSMHTSFNYFKFIFHITEEQILSFHYVTLNHLNLSTTHSIWGSSYLFKVLQSHLSAMCPAISCSAPQCAIHKWTSATVVCSFLVLGIFSHFLLGKMLLFLQILTQLWHLISPLIQIYLSLLYWTALTLSLMLNYVTLVSGDPLKI